MGDEKNSDTRLDAMIRRTLASGLDTSGAGCPSSDLLAAFTENTLSAPERAKCNTHIAGCAVCQRQLAALARADALGANRDQPFVAAATLASEPAEIEYVDADEAREEAGGLWQTIRSAMLFSLGPMPLSIAIHIAVLLFLIITVHDQRGRELIMGNLVAGGGGGGGNEMQDLDMPEVPMPHQAPQQMEAPTAVDTSQAAAWPKTTGAPPAAGGFGIGTAAGVALATGLGSATASAGVSGQVGA